MGQKIEPFSYPAMKAWRISAEKMTEARRIRHLRRLGDTFFAEEEKKLSRKKVSERRARQEDWPWQKSGVAQMKTSFGSDTRYSYVLERRKTTWFWCRLQRQNGFQIGI